MYIVISIPKRKSVARGVSQRMCILLISFAAARYRIFTGPAKPPPHYVRPAPGRCRGLTLEAAGDRDTPGQALERASRGCLGDVLAPQWLALAVLAAKALAVAGPQNAVIRGSEHLHRAAGEAVGTDDLVVGVATAPKAKGHGQSLTHLTCGWSVDYLCIDRFRPARPGAGAPQETIFALMASYSASVMSFASSSCLASDRRRTASPSPAAPAPATALPGMT